MAAAGHCVLLAREGDGVVVADGRFVLDDGDEALHAVAKATGCWGAVKALRGCHFAPRLVAAAGTFPSAT
jgi:hypothetical protein